MWDVSAGIKGRERRQVKMGLYKVGCFATDTMKRRAVWGMIPICPFLSPQASFLPLLHPDTGMTFSPRSLVSSAQALPAADWQQCPQGRQSALDKHISGRPSTSKGVFHLSNVNINLLICPGAVKHSSPKGKKKFPTVRSLYLPLLIAGLISKLIQPSGQESHATAPANGASGPAPASASRVPTAAGVTGPSP